MNIIGIDAGSSAIKLVVANEKLQLMKKDTFEKMPIKTALTKFITQKNIKLEEIAKIVLTGVGTDEIQENLYNIPTVKIDEFVSIGQGGLHLSSKKEGLIVSIGTGTAFVEANGTESTHIGGTGVGGGTLLKLCDKMCNLQTIQEINEAIELGSLKNVNLSINDVCTREIKTLPKDTTSANFGKLNSNATRNDLAKGIANMVFETIGMMAVFATHNKANKNIIVIGNVACMPYIKIVLSNIEKIHKQVNFIIPKNAEYACIIGAIKAAT